MHLRLLFKYSVKVVLILFYRIQMLVLCGKDEIFLFCFGKIIVTNINSYYSIRHKLCDAKVITIKFISQYELNRRKQYQCSLEDVSPFAWNTSSSFSSSLSLSYFFFILRIYMFFHIFCYFNLKFDCHFILCDESNEFKRVKNFHIS